ncbi:hypothetical protein NQ317_015551 [Molorchus minor]|uniref:Uncharacterized protein n=1 Tax=Molorchus minor TaxID=1323400 RepID=A0ABQ9JEV7_9CUCU|nr:hypothetical protein NQ317_015551 [Molorchus minor]
MPKWIRLVYAWPKLVIGVYGKNHKNKTIVWPGVIFYCLSGQSVHYSGVRVGKPEKRLQKGELYRSARTAKRHCWPYCPGNATSKNLYKRAFAETKCLVDMKGRDIRMVTGLLTGHCNLSRHLQLIEIAEVRIFCDSMVPENRTFKNTSTPILLTTLKEHWRLSRGCRQVRDFVKGPDPARSVWILGRSRETLNQLVGILTGHCKLTRHLSLLGIEEDPTCPRCGEDDETTQSSEELDSLGWSDILTSIRRSGRLSEGVGRVNSVPSKAIPVINHGFYSGLIPITPKQLLSPGVRFKWKWRNVELRTVQIASPAYKITIKG